jgi:nucleoside diphosphate kinase
VANRYSFAFIKPEGAEKTEAILSYLRDAGLTIVHSTDAFMTEHHIQGLYGHVPPHIMPRLKNQLLAKTCKVLVVQSNKDAVVELVRVCGEKTPPGDCAPQSIRYQLGSHRENEEHLNVIHRPKTAKERDENLALFGLLAFNS